MLFSGAESSLYQWFWKCGPRPTASTPAGHQLAVQTLKPTPGLLNQKPWEQVQQCTLTSLQVIPMYSKVWRLLLCTISEKFSSNALRNQGNQLCKAWEGWEQQDWGWGWGERKKNNKERKGGGDSCSFCRAWVCLLLSFESWHQQVCCGVE